VSIIRTVYSSPKAIYGHICNFGILYTRTGDPFHHRWWKCKKKTKLIYDWKGFFSFVRNCQCICKIFNWIIISGSVIDQSNVIFFHIQTKCYLWPWQLECQHTCMKAGQMYNTIWVFENRWTFTKLHMWPYIDVQIKYLTKFWHLHQFSSAVKFDRQKYSDLKVYLSMPLSL
jgi:hypothetical protein